MLRRVILMIHKARSAGIAATSLFAFVWLGSFQAASAQAPAAGSNPAPPQASANPPADPSGGDKKTGKPAGNGGSAAPATTPAQTKKPKVITNDDINADRARHHDGFAGGAGNSHGTAGTGICDDQCADEARQMTGFGPDQDGEWRFALTAARRNLAQDTAWPGAYVTLTRAVEADCTFQQQLQMTAVPSGNEYWSQVERARREKYAEDMSRVLGQNVTNANAQIERMAEQADESEPARAAMMRVLAQHVNDSCDP
jgi:hypothetical protein